MNEASGVYDEELKKRRQEQYPIPPQLYAINDFGHQGLTHDEETGLIENRARMRSPQLDWLQREPLGYIDGMSLYQYERSRVTFWLDPTGLQVVDSDAPFGSDEYWDDWWEERRRKYGPGAGDNWDKGKEHNKTYNCIAYAFDCDKPLQHRTPDDPHQYALDQDCRPVQANTTCNEDEKKKAISYPKGKPDDYHAARQDGDTWSAKLDDRMRIGNITNLTNHHRAAYGGKDIVVKYYCCPKCPKDN